MEREIIKKLDKIIELLEKLIVVTAASAIADPSSSVGPYDRQNAAQYAKKQFDNDD